MPSSPAKSLGMHLHIARMNTRKCKVCALDFQPTNNNHKYCSTKCSTSLQVERSYKYLNNNLEAYILLLIKKEGRRHLDVKDVLSIYNTQKGLCALSKVPLTCIKIPNSKKVHTNLSIDRIDSSKGYKLDNLQLVCAIVNVMKSSLTMEEFKWWIKMLNGVQNA